MDFKAAAATVLPFGKFKGRTLDQAAETDEGLRYLDWLVGQAWLKPGLKSALQAYLSDRGIKSDLDTSIPDGAQTALDEERGQATGEGVEW